MDSRQATIIGSTPTLNIQKKTGLKTCWPTAQSALTFDTAWAAADEETVVKTSFYGIIIALGWLSYAVTFAEPSGWAKSIAWSPDGDTIAVGSSDGLWLFDDAFNEVGFVPLPQFEGFPPTSTQWSADGDLIALAILHIPSFHREERFFTGAFPLLVVDADRLIVTNEIDLPRPKSPIRWHPRDHRILFGSKDSNTYIVDAITGNVEYTFEGRIDHWDSVIADSVCWVSDSIVALFDTSDIYVIDTVRHEILHRLEAGRSGSGEAYKPASCSKDGRAVHGFSHVYNLLRGERDLINSPAGSIDLSDYWYYEWHGVALAFSPDGKKVATNGNLSLCRTATFDAESLLLLAEIQGSYAKWGGYYFQDSIAWHPAGEKLAIVGQFDIRIWDAETYELLQRYEGFNAGFYDPHPTSRGRGR